ncbi:CAAX geranylgeranyltransferase alpha subunit [Tilletia horrida]|uniref:Protein farnesyltransferase/geranylgeranyltransferase type-1 subunit alpha n=1 Tax=Tilletia horrida TaxID=155126 RepID=A0AAN6GI57_9BASI|nr:CAAX geranylgeranyltransferase alpha subunit [Tilletia horrida]KAK0558530.1 CAAX geranylgeranyltransferase alpha subunit [Tilletia horrida]
MPFDAALPIWADVKPIPQSDTDAPLCPILYSPEYSAAMDLLRALRSSQEHSARALTLTEHLVRLNPSNFTVWDYRAHVLINGTHFTDQSARSQALRAELDLLDDMATGSMKNYQIW